VALSRELPPFFGDVYGWTTIPPIEPNRFSELFDLPAIDRRCAA
jgi:hypothetical protein